MADFTIELTDESKKAFNDSLTKYNKDTESALQKLIAKTGLQILSDSISNLKANGNIASGKLAKNGRFKKIAGEIAIEVEYTGYAGAIEFGRKSGKMPPLADIMQWVKRKGIASGKAIKVVAFLIARSIARNGTKAHPFLKPAYDKNTQGFESKIISVINGVNF